MFLETILMYRKEDHNNNNIHLFKANVVECDSMRFVIDNVALGRDLLPVIQLSPVSTAR